MIKLKLKKIDGKLAFVPPADFYSRAELKKLFKKCAEKYDNFIDVSFDVPRRRRTTGKGSQNSCIHGYAACIAEYTGDDSASVLTAVKKRAFRRGYPAKKDESGNVIFSVFDGEPVPESTAEISTVEAGFLIEELQQLAAELSIILPPTDGERNDFSGG